MNDGIIKGTGNSRFLKSAISDNMTWEQFRALIRAGTLPIDLFGINPAGWDQLATALNKANLLTDETAELLELTGNPTVNDAIANLVYRAKIATGFYYGTGVIHRQSNPKTINIAFSPFLFILSNENISIFADADLSDGNVYVGQDTITLLGQSGTVKNKYLQYTGETTFFRDGKIIYEAGNGGLSFYLEEQSGFPATSAKDVYNGSAELYRWIAIGVGSE